MSGENLWGEIADPVGQRTPYSIAREQATILTEITKGLLIGSLDQQQHPTVLIYNFEIKAPGLNNYKILIFTMSYPLISIYPVAIADRLNNVHSQCANEDQFVATLKTILSSKKAKDVISALLIQTKETRRV